MKEYKLTDQDQNKLPTKSSILKTPAGENAEWKSENHAFLSTHISQTEENICWQFSRSQTKKCLRPFKLTFKVFIRL